MLLVEDVGELPLFEAALHGDAGDLTGWPPMNCWCCIWKGRGGSTSTASRRGSPTTSGSFVGKLAQFLEVGIAQVSAAVDPASIAPELDDLAARLGRYPRVLSHRDYHGHNLFLNQ